MSRQLRVDIAEHSNVPGCATTIREIRIMVFDPNSQISHPYDKATTIQDIEDLGQQLHQYQALIQAIKEANTVLWAV